MKKLLVILVLSLVILACKEYTEIDPCIDVSEVQISFDSNPCQVPCTKTFNLSEFNLIQEAELNWTLAGPNGPIPIDDPKATSIEKELLDGGIYTIAVQITFPFKGCDFSRDSSFFVGVDQPQAIIKVDTTTCTVGTCNLTFWQENINADSWTWSFPEPDDNEYANWDTVEYSFNDAPGTYEVCLEACNGFGDCNSACVTITVLPKTFILDDDNGLGLEKILCIKENTNGSFSAIGANLNETFTIDISRKGELITNSLVRLPGLENVYDEFEALACRPLGSNYLVYGSARRGQNIDMYLAGFNPNFVPNGDEETLFHNSTGNEVVSAVTTGNSGDLVACGTASGGIEAGMFFFIADGSLVLQDHKIHFSGSAANKALDILDRGSEYLVAGRAMNPISEQIEGVYFSLDADLDTIKNSIHYIGSNLTPIHMVPTGTGVILVAKEGIASSVIRPLDSTTPETPFSNTIFAQTIVISGNRLASVGYNGVSNRKPLLQILSLPNLAILNTVNEPYPVENAELFCVSETADGGFIMGGTIDTGSGDQVLIIRTDKEGKLLTP